MNDTMSCDKQDYNENTINDNVTCSKPKSCSKILKAFMISKGIERILSCILFQCQPIGHSGVKYCDNLDYDKNTMSNNVLEESNKKL